jgi:hypothetical protein
MACVADSSNKQPQAGACAPQISVRLIVARESNCPSVGIDGVPVATVERRPDLQRAEAFEAIKLCVAYHRARADSVTFSDGTEVPVRLRQSTSGPDRIAIFGDTGCRGNPKQACKGDKWPFGKIAANVAYDNPDLIVHLGDYLYTDNDNWTDWRKYFFEPARFLLKSAPWMLVRGNHENLQEGNQWAGYEYFFGEQERLRLDDEIEGAKPYAIDLSAKLRVIVADSSISFAFKKVESGDLSSANCDTWPGKDKGICDVIKAQLRFVVNLMPPPSESNPQVWLMTHVPVFGLEREDEEDKATKKKQKVDRIPKPSAMMLSAWMKNRVTGINRIFSGDRHLLQVITPNGQPIQIAVGTGGVNLDDFPKTLDPLTNLGIDLGTVNESTNAADAPPSTDQWCGYQGHGYLWAERKDTDYLFKFVPIPTPAPGTIDLCANRMNHGLAPAALSKR